MPTRHRIDLLADGWSRPAVLRALVAPDRRRTLWTSWRQAFARLWAIWWLWERRLP